MSWLETWQLNKSPNTTQPTSQPHFSHPFPVIEIHQNENQCFLNFFFHIIYSWELIFIFYIGFPFTLTPSLATSISAKSPAGFSFFILSLM